MRQIIIYGLKDSKNGIIKYVGKTCNKLNQRINQHIFKSKTGYNSPLYAWIEYKFNKPKINLKKRKVINIETNEIYESVVDACNKSGISKSKMLSILKGENKLKNYIYG